MAVGDAGSSEARWEWESSPAASEVPAWMRVGTGHDGALHRAAVFLAAIRRSEQAVGRPEWAFVSATDIDATGLVQGFAVTELLQELEQFGVVERSTASPFTWRATAALVTQIDEAYRSRHPME